ncbi:uncharacterized protein LOC126676693 isoform X2 [Mercurialis annua]|uniref:uncharacterized protein LOC126676693 isoform X2 n=1 Tax=Mercurialis annua TaxID=3986 RepID=UPI00215EC6DF|nr:uncharacterized protein LOC126676693 isoform X2 [Mercurialis annua]
MGTKFKVIEDIKKSLSARQLELLGETFLGHFLELKPILNQLQLLHSILMREMKNSNTSELWVKISGYKLRFSIEEFAVVSGLRCVGECNTLSISTSENTLIQTYFPNCEVTRDGLGFLILSKAFKTDEDAVKLAVIYMYECFLCSNESTYQHVSRFLLDMVDRGDYNSFSWGILVFRATICDMKNRAAAKKILQFYRLNGFSLALQLWFYEVCPYATNKICLLDESAPSVPRMLKWYNVDMKLKKKYLNETFYCQSREQLQLKNITPTLKEKSTLMLTGFFQSGKKKLVEDVEDSSDDEQILGDFIKLKKGESSKQKKSFDILKNRLDLIASSQEKTFSCIQKQLNCVIDAIQLIRKRLAIDQHFLFAGDVDLNNAANVNVKDGYVKVGEENEKEVFNRTTAAAKKQFVDDLFTEMQVQDNAANNDDAVNNDDAANNDDDANNDNSGPALTEIESDGIVRDLSMGDKQDTEENEYGGAGLGGNVNENVVGNRREVDNDGGAGLSVFPASDTLPNLSELVFEKDKGGTSSHIVADDITPQDTKRIVRPSRLVQSPFLAQFSSGDSEVKDVGDCFVMSRLFVFDKNIGDLLMCAQLVEYKKWINYGKLKIARPKEGRYCKEVVSKIEPPFDFGVGEVSTKDWFHIIHFGNMPLEDLHVDLLFYYLRKKREV